MLTNNGNVSLLMSVWLAADDYDLNFNPNVVSVTELQDPIRSIVLSRRMKAEKQKAPKDIMDAVQSRMGTAIHQAVEDAWLERRDIALKKLGYPQSMIDRIRINPDKEDPNSDHIYIYLENRNTIEINGMTVSGRYDAVIEGEVKDVKSTKVYNWIHGGNWYKYGMQGSMYRVINPDIITKDTMNVELVFTDWNQWEAIKGGDYPRYRAMTKQLMLTSIPKTRDWMHERIGLIKQYKDSPQDELPICNSEELWQNPAKWAYKKNPANKKATKLYDTHGEALVRQAEDGMVGSIEERPSVPTFCKFCDALSVCNQGQGHIASGLLKL